jgi:hypothetical protein
MHARLRSSSDGLGGLRGSDCNGCCGNNGFHLVVREAAALGAACSVVSSVRRMICKRGVDSLPNMLRAIRRIAFAAALAVAAFAVSGRAWTTSPKEVVDRFVKMDVQGARLTPQGWRAADALFAKPSEPFQAKVVVVIARSYSVSAATDRANTTEFYMGYEEVGRIATSSLQFAPTRDGYMNQFDKYTVVLIEVQGPHENSNVAKHKDDMSTEWKIDGAQPTAMHLTAEAAIKYVKQMRNETTDPAIRRKAARTLAKLAPYR